MNFLSIANRGGLLAKQGGKPHKTNPITTGNFFFVSAAGRNDCFFSKAEVNFDCFFLD
jgi:hypothetical protein